MKKIAIAAFAALSLAASAQVTISGKIGEYVDTTKTGSVRATGITTEPTSNIAFGVKEDLGGGLSARVAVETSLSGNTIAGTGTQLGDRQSTVGLANKLGSIDVGRNVHSQFLAISDNDPFKTLYGSIAGDVHNLRGLRFSNGAFVSVSPVKGVTANWDRSNNVPGAADQTAAALTASFGPVSATLAEYQSGVEKSTVVAAGAKLGATNVFYSHSDNKSATAGETKKGDLVGVAQKMGAFTAKASYGRTNTTVKAYNVGVDYALSKRTEVGVALRDVNYVGTANDIKQVGVGLVHRF